MGNPFRLFASFRYIPIPDKVKLTDKDSGSTTKLAIVWLILLSSSISFPTLALSSPVSYPSFLLSYECYLENTFLVICNTSLYPPKPFLYSLGNDGLVKRIHPDGNIQLLNYSFKYDLRSNELVDAPEEVIKGAATNMGCIVARKYSSSRYACRSVHSICTDTNSTRGYMCQCLLGYHGTPYHPYGCKDVNECETTYPCVGECVNEQGSFKCHCPEGFVGDGKKAGSGCRKDQATKIVNHRSALSLDHRKVASFPVSPVTHPKSTVSILAAIMFFSLGLPAFFVLTLMPIDSERAIQDSKKRNYRQNGGHILEKRQRTRDPTRRIIQYESERVDTVTGVYRNILRDENSKVDIAEYNREFKGTYSHIYIGNNSNKTVAVKTIPASIGNDPGPFIEQLMFLAEPHSNLVRIMGCTLETESPVLMYELEEGAVMDASVTLFTMIKHNINFTWANRLKAARGCAKALAYLHDMKRGPQVVHGMFNSRNVLWDTNSNEAKVFNSAPCTTPRVHSSRYDGVYEDPEVGILSNFHDGEVTDNDVHVLSVMSNVYSFGVLLVELLATCNAFHIVRDSIRGPIPPARVMTSNQMTTALRDLVLELVQGHELFGNGTPEEMVQMKEVAKLAERCIVAQQGTSSRPTMKTLEVALANIAGERKRGLFQKLSSGTKKVMQNLFH